MTDFMNTVKKYYNSTNLPFILLRKTLKFIYKALEFLLIGIFILLERVVWKLTEPVVTYLRELGILQKLRAKIEKQNRYVVLFIFLVPFLISEVTGTMALGYISMAEFKIGIPLYLSKIPLGIFSFWILDIEKERLLSFKWFEKCYNFAIKIIDKIKNSKAYINVMNRYFIVKTKVLEFFSYCKEKWTIFKEALNKVKLSLFGNKKSYIEKFVRKYKKMKKCFDQTLEKRKGKTNGTN